MDERDAILAGAAAVIAGFVLITCVIAWMYAQRLDRPSCPWDDAPGEVPRDPRGGS